MMTPQRLSEGKFPRLVSRNLPFHQSRNHVNIAHRKSRVQAFWGLLKEDWFHVMLRQKTLYSVLVLLAAWTASILIFAGVYMAVDQAYLGTDCGLGGVAGLGFGAAFAFSLETCTTVGYGLPGSTNAFFENCGAIQAVIYLQMVWSMMYNAFLFAFFFARISRSELRGSQVVFGNKCVIRKSCSDDGDDRWILQIRIHDVDAKFPVVESHVRIYVRRKQTSELIPLRILSPDDELGAVLWTSWPSVVTHEVDLYSPLYPPMAAVGRRKNLLKTGGILLRQADSVNGSREEIVCPICGETYGDWERLRRHIAYNQIVEIKDEYPEEGTHRSLKVEDYEEPPPPPQHEIEKNFPEEILVLVEGIDPLASGTFQALQSYTKEDVVFGGSFASCMAKDDDKHVVYMENFHKVEHSIV